MALDSTLGISRRNYSDAVTGGIKAALICGCKLSLVFFPGRASYCVLSYLRGLRLYVYSKQVRSVTLNDLRLPFFVLPLIRIY